MSKHEHTAKHDPGDKPTQDEVAKKAYGIYVKEGRPQGYADQNWSDAEAQLQHAGAGQADHPEHQDEHKGHQDHHAHIAADFAGPDAADPRALAAAANAAGSA